MRSPQAGSSALVAEHLGEERGGGGRVQPSFEGSQVGGRENSLSNLYAPKAKREDAR
jgi:hypothetical protein